MRKLIAAINMTLDGYCDHTAVDPDDEIHDHYSELIRSADDIVYGRITYQLMEYWPTVIENPTGVKAIDDFAVTIDNISKTVFSRTLKNLTWRNSRLATQSVYDEVMRMKMQEGRDILVGSPSLIIETLNLALVDEFQLCIHPVVAGSGKPLFKDLRPDCSFRMTDTKKFNRGAILLYYQPFYREEK